MSRAPTGHDASFSGRGSTTSCKEGSGGEPPLRGPRQWGKKRKGNAPPSLTSALPLCVVLQELAAKGRWERCLRTALQADWPRRAASYSSPAERRTADGARRLGVYGASASKGRCQRPPQTPPSISSSGISELTIARTIEGMWKIFVVKLRPPTEPRQQSTARHTARSELHHAAT